MSTTDPNAPTPKEAKAQAKAARAYAKAHRRWYQKKRTWVAGIVALIVVIGFGASLGSTGDSPTATSDDNANEAPGANDDSAAAGDDTSEEAGAAATEAAAEEPAFAGARDTDVIGEVGETLSLSSAAVTATELTDGDATLGQTLCSTVTMQNNTEDAIDFNALDWQLQLPSGTILNTGFAGSSDQLSGGQIAPGGTMSGDVCFDVESPEDGQYVLLYEATFSLSSERGAWISERVSS